MLSNVVQSWYLDIYLLLGEETFLKEHMLMTANQNNMFIQIVSADFHHYQKQRISTYIAIR